MFAIMPVIRFLEEQLICVFHDHLYSVCPDQAAEALGDAGKLVWRINPA